MKGRAWVALAAVAVGCRPTTPVRGPEPTAALPGRFEVVGRGPVTWTQSVGLWVFRAPNGRTYAWTGTWGACRGCIGGRMYVWDVTDPRRPVRTDSVLLDARIVPDMMTNRAGTLGVVARVGAASRRNGIVVLDLADPAHPKVLSEYWETLTGDVAAVYVHGDYVYVAHRGTGDLHIIDVRNPREPREVGRWGVPLTGFDKQLNDVWIEDGLAYLAYGDDGLVILDVGRGIKKGTPERPQLVSQYRYRTQWQGRTYGNTYMAVPYASSTGKRYVFVSDEVLPPNAAAAIEQGEPFTTGGYVHVFDVTNPEKPTEVAWYDRPEAGAEQLWVARDTLYIGYTTAGLRAVRVDGELRGDLRRAGREVAALLTGDSVAFRPGRTFTLTPMVLGPYVYALDFHSGLWVARVVPAAP